MRRKGSMLSWPRSERHCTGMLLFSTFRPVQVIIILAMKKHDRDAVFLYFYIAETLDNYLFKLFMYA